MLSAASDATDQLHLNLEAGAGPSSEKIIQVMLGVMDGCVGERSGDTEGESRSVS